MSILDLIAKDPNVSSDYRRQFDKIVHPQSNLLVRRAHVAAQRRFTGEPQTGFGVLGDEVYGPMNPDDDEPQTRAQAMAEYDQELADDCRDVDCKDIDSHWGDLA